jgi:hypothetical protein
VSVKPTAPVRAKRKAKSIYYAIAPVRLYLDDVETLFGIASQAGGAVTVETEEHEADGPAELAEAAAGAKVKELSVLSRRPSIHLHVKGGTVTIYSDTGDPLCRGVADELREYLRSRRRWFASLVPPWYGALALVVGMGFAIYFSNQIPGQPRWTWAKLSLLVLAVLLALAGTAALLDLRRSVVILSRRGDAKSWWARNRDPMLQTTVGAVIGGFVIYILTRLFR